MPVYCRRLRQPVGEPDLQNVAHPRPDRGARDLPVVAPSPCDSPGGEVPIDFSSLQVELNDSASRRGNSRLVGFGVGFGRTGHDSMSYEAVTVFMCGGVVRGGVVMMLMVVVW